MTKEWCYTWAHDLDQYDLVSFIDANKQFIIYITFFTNNMINSI